MSPAPQPDPASPPSSLVLAEVKYSLPEMLHELTAERAAATFAMEKLDQFEIGKLFNTRTPRRAKPKK